MLTQFRIVKYYYLLTKMQNNNSDASSSQLDQLLKLLQNDNSTINNNSSNNNNNSAEKNLIENTQELDQIDVEKANQQLKQLGNILQNSDKVLFNSIGEVLKLDFGNFEVSFTAKRSKHRERKIELDLPEVDRSVSNYHNSNNNNNNNNSNSNGRMSSNVFLNSPPISGNFNDNSFTSALKNMVSSLNQEQKATLLSTYGALQSNNNNSNNFQTNKNNHKIRSISSSPGSSINRNSFNRNNSSNSSIKNSYNSSSFKNNRTSKNSSSSVLNSCVSYQVGNLGPNSSLNQRSKNDSLYSENNSHMNNIINNSFENSNDQNPTDGGISDLYEKNTNQMQFESISAMKMYCKFKYCANGMITHSPTVQSKATGQIFSLNPMISCKDIGVYTIECVQENCTFQSVVQTNKPFRDQLRLKICYFKQYFEGIIDSKNRKLDLCVHYKESHPDFCRDGLFLEDCYKVTYLSKANSTDALTKLFLDWKRKLSYYSPDYSNISNGPHSNNSLLDHLKNGESSADLFEKSSIISTNKNTRKRRKSEVLDQDLDDLPSLVKIESVDNQ